MFGKINLCYRGFNLKESHAKTPRHKEEPGGFVVVSELLVFEPAKSSKAMIGIYSLGNSFERSQSTSK